MSTANQAKHVLKKDKYSRVRKGKSCFLDIYCSACNAHIALYQKDGPGSLIRLYLDRIREPKEISGLQLLVSGKDGMQTLHCLQCMAIIGIPMVFQAENRLAFRLVRGSFSKRLSDGTCAPNDNLLPS